MKFAPDAINAKYLITRYTDDCITINDVDYTGSLIVGSTTLIDDWRPQTFAQLNPADFDPLLALNPEIVILGVGQKHQFPEPRLLSAFYSRHIGVEVMTTAAACRTFNLLISEGRSIVAALLRG